ncbi:MAG: LPS export ABC transporter periplasmic protein LptC [Schwartzia sp.]|nr:LPS export ABC transporter periplasmic protein LptC [Schwartzia sp. (in: firmicutes)]
MGRKKLAAIGAVVIFAALAAWVTLSIPEPPAPQDPGATKKKEMEYGKNTIREEVGGKLIWELTTASSSIDVKTQDTTFTGAKGKYYFEDGKVLVMTAKEGRYESKTRNLKLIGDVEAVMSDGSKLTSRELEWVAKEDRLIATGKARVSKPDVSLEADRIESWDQFQEFRATGNAHLVREQDGKGANEK